METKEDRWNLTYGVSGSDIILSWEEQEAAEGYLIWGSDYYNVFHIIGAVAAEDTTFVWSAFEKKLINKVKVTAFVNAYGRRVTFAESNPIPVSGYKEEEMFLHTCKSYNGVTLSWIDMDFADGYYVYQKKDENWECICELSDYQISFEALALGDSFIISAYRVKDGKKECFKFSKPYLYEMVDTGGTGTSKVSVVMPCYNNEIFVARGIDSVLLSTFQDFELILVDDGSTDKTGEILDWYQREYPAIVKVIHKENGGVADARNAGIEVAGGEAICFPDSDDMIHPRMLELMYKNMVEKKVDAVVSQFHWDENDNRYRSFCLPVETDSVIEVEKILDQMYTYGFMMPAVWNKLYQTDMVKQHSFPRLIMEDSAWTPYILSYCNLASYIAYPLYRWDRRVQDQQVTATNEIAHLKRNDRITKDIEMVNFYLENGAEDKRENLVGVATRRIVKYIDKHKDWREYRDLLQTIDGKYGPILENTCIKADSELCQKAREYLGNNI